MATGNPIAMILIGIEGEVRGVVEEPASSGPKRTK